MTPVPTVARRRAWHERLNQRRPSFEGKAQFSGNIVFSEFGIERSDLLVTELPPRL